MKIGRIGFYLWMLVLLPLTTYAELAGYVVYRHPYNYDEIWITDIRDTRNARLLYKHTNVIRSLSGQKDGRYIAIVSTNEIEPFKVDIYFIDTLRSHAVQIQTKIKYIESIDISHDGDVVFTNLGRGIPKQGIYLIQRSEIGKPDPRITLLKEGSIPRVDWAPNGKEIAYDRINGLFQIDVDTKQETRISGIGSFPVFSPDGKKLAYYYANVATGNPQIDIISLDTRQPIMTIDLITHPQGLNWSPDGEYLIYTVRVSQFLKKQLTYRNIAIPINGAPLEEYWI